MGKIQVNTVNRSDINIIGDNVLFDNGIITAFYILPLRNYSINSAQGIDYSIQELVSLITNLTVTYPTISFTIERINKTTQRIDVIHNLYETIQFYAPDFTMPKEFTDNIRKNEKDYAILGINIEQSDIADIEELTIKDTAKTLMKNVVNKFTGLGNMNADIEKILRIEDNIYRIIRGSVVRASKDIVFYTYVSKLYPCYEISYDRLSYINETNYSSIIQNVTQVVEDNFGWFEMKNTGIEIFGAPAQTTYGCVLNVAQFPLQIQSYNFLMDYPNLVTTIQCLKKEDAKLRLKRTRASDRYERNQAIEADADIEQIEEAQQNIDIATHAIQQLEAGEVLCRFNATILVFASDKDELKKYAQKVINHGKDNQIMISKSLTQALDFLNLYVSKRPQKLIHMAPLSFPMSFQQNAGADVGDSDTDSWWSPAIGEDLM